MTKKIPILFTLLNLFTGALAIIFALQTDAIIITQDEHLVGSFNIPEGMAWAGICIMIAAIVDFLDGFLARLMNATSELGKQLDSLSDVVSFGVAPAVLLYQLLRLSYAREPGGIYTPIIYLLPTILLACAAAYRLGKFNISTDQQHSFRGVPVPAVGILIASLPLILHFNNYPFVNGIIVNKWIIYISIVVLSYLMVSNHRIIALKSAIFELKKNVLLIVLAVLVVVAAVSLKWLSIPIIFVLYILFSFLTPKSNLE